MSENCKERRTVPDAPPHEDGEHDNADCRRPVCTVGGEGGGDNKK